MTSVARYGDSAEPTAARTIIAAEIQYARVRPITSASRPKTVAPRKAAPSMTALSSASWPASRCHWPFSRVETMPITNRS